MKRVRLPLLIHNEFAVSLTSTRKSSSIGKKNSIPDDVPIRLAVTFAPSRARVMTGVHGALYPRQTRKSADSLFVMANHGQLLEYSLDPVPDQSKLTEREKLNNIE